MAPQAHPVPQRTWSRHTCSSTASRPSCTCSRSVVAAAVRRAVQRDLSAVVHGALPEATAAVSAPARTRLHSVVRCLLRAGCTEARTLALIHVPAIMQAAVSRIDKRQRKASARDIRPQGRDRASWLDKVALAAKRRTQGTPELQANGLVEESA